MICPVEAAVHKQTGTVFFTDAQANHIVMCNLHCPATLTPSAGKRTSGLRDGKKSLNEPSGVCLCGHLLFVCDSGNSAVRVVVSRLLSRKKGDILLSSSPENKDDEDVDDSIPIEGIFVTTVTKTMKLVITGLQLQQPFSIFVGRRASTITRPRRSLCRRH